MEDPDASSTLSLKDITSGAVISSEEWDFVSNKHLGGKQRIKKIKNLMSKYSKDQDTIMLDEFLQECMNAIEMENKNLQENSNKDLFAKYLSLYPQIGFLCSICSESNVHYKNVLGLMTHVNRSHFTEILTLFNDSGNEQHFKKIRSSLGKINFKSSLYKSMTADEFQKIVNIHDTFETVASTDTISIISIENEFDTAHATVVDQCIQQNLKYIDEEVNMVIDKFGCLNKNLDTVSPQSRFMPQPALMPDNGPSSIETETPPSSAPHSVTFDDFILDDEEVVDVPSLFGDLEEENTSVEVPESILKTINMDDIADPTKSSEVNNSTENVNSKQYINMNSIESVAPVSPESIANSEDMEVDDSVHNSTIETDNEKSPIPPIIVHEPVVKKRIPIAEKKPKTKYLKKVTKRKVPESEISVKVSKKRKIEHPSPPPKVAKTPRKYNRTKKKEILTKKPRSTAKNSNGIIVPRTAQTRLRRTRDEDNSVWSHELVTSIEQHASNEITEINNNPQRKKLINCIKDSVNIPIAKRKSLKSKINDAFKKFEMTECNEKTNPECRDSLAFLANCKIDSEYFSKKTNKANNPFRTSELTRQVKVYLNFYSKLGSVQKTNAQVKQEVEAALNKKCKDTDNINSWKHNLKSLNVSTPKEFEKKLSKLTTQYNKIPEIHNILVAMKTGITVYKSDNSSDLKYDLKISKNHAKNKSGNVKLIKNLLLQLGKGSLSNMKSILNESHAQSYVNWFKDYRRTKEALSISNNVKWFMTCVEGVLHGGNSPMNPLARISRTEIEKVVKNMVELVKSNCYVDSNDNDNDTELFTSSFYQNLTIFCMKYIYEIYNEILKYYKMYPAKCQQPNLIHVGLFHRSQAIVSNKTQISAEDIIKQYTQFMKNQSTKKSAGISNVFGVNKLIMCLFQMKFIASRLDVESASDFKNVINSNELVKVIDLIESKCSVRVIHHIKSMIFEVLYNIINNIISPRTESSDVFTKKISWNFYSKILFNAEYFKYPRIALKVLTSFKPISLKGGGEPAKDDVIFDDDVRVWHTVLHKYRTQLFSELYSDYLSMFSCTEVSDEEMNELENQRYGSANVNNVDSSSSSSSDDSDDDNADDDNVKNNDDSDGDSDDDGGDDDDEEEEGEADDDEEEEGEADDDDSD